MSDRVRMGDFNAVADMAIGPGLEGSSLPSLGRPGQPDNRRESPVTDGVVCPGSRPDCTRTPPPLALESEILDKFGRDVRLAGVAGEQR